MSPPLRAQGKSPRKYQQRGRWQRFPPIVPWFLSCGVAIEAALSLGAPVVELHTGKYAHAEGEAQTHELRRLSDAAALAAGTRVRVTDRRGGYAEIRTRGVTAWVPDRAISPLPRAL